LLLWGVMSRGMSCIAFCQRISNLSQYAIHSHPFTTLVIQSANQKSSQLLFGANTSIFYNVTHRCIDEDTRKRFLEQGPDESTSRWITEIAENKEACFPGLRSVELREILKDVARPHWRAVEERWEPTPAMRKAFEKAGVELEIWIRDDEKPQPWIPRMYPR